MKNNRQSFVAGAGMRFFSPWVPLAAQRLKSF
jgi:hypothetical protein